MTDRMTHDASVIRKSCRKNLSYLSFPHEMPDNLSCDCMTHDRYDRYLYSSHTRAHKNAMPETAQSVMRHAAGRAAR